MEAAGSGTYDFDCDLTLAEMSAALNGAGPWQWTMHDSYWYGDYLLTRPGQSETRVRLIEYRQMEHLRMPGTVRSLQDSLYLVDTYWVSDEPQGSKRSLPLAALDRIIREQILPTIGARDVRPAVGF